MALGFPDSEKIWNDVYDPVIRKCGLEPKRLDKNSMGSALNEQLNNYISTSALIIGDLTHERPNCYYEVGYAFGLNKHDNTILCCKQNHDLHRKDRVGADPKIHFDLQSYPIVWWSIDDIEKAKKELEEVIQFRLKSLPESKEILQARLSLKEKLTKIFNKLRGEG